MGIGEPVVYHISLAERSAVLGGLVQRGAVDGRRVVGQLVRGVTDEPFRRMWRADKSPCPRPASAACTCLLSKLESPASRLRPEGCEALSFTLYRDTHAISLEIENYRSKTVAF